MHGTIWFCGVLLMPFAATQVEAADPSASKVHMVRTLEEGAALPANAIVGKSLLHLAEAAGAKAKKAVAPASAAQPIAKPAAEAPAAEASAAEAPAPEAPAAEAPAAEAAAVQAPAVQAAAVQAPTISRERAHVGAALSFVGLMANSNDLGYSFGLRGGGRIGQFFEADVLVSALVDGSTIYAIPALLQLNGVALDDTSRSGVEAYTGLQVGMMDRRTGIGDVYSFAFGGQVGVATHLSRRFALRFEMSWLHANEANLKNSKGTYFSNSADIFQLQIAPCLSF